MIRPNRFIRVMLFFLVMLSYSAPATNYATATASAQDREVAVIINGVPLVSDVKPLNIDRHVYVPLRAIFEAHGAVITWHEEYRLIEAVRGSHTIRYQIDGTTLNVDGKNIDLELKPVIVKGRTLAPVRAISEALGSDVKWDDETGTVTIATVDTSAVDARQPDIKLALTSDARSQITSNSGFVLKVEYYGVKENRFYTSMTVTNSQNKEIRFSLAPGDKKIFAEFSKTKDPMPSLTYENCTKPRDQTVNDGLGHIYTVPEFYTDSECLSRNEANKAQFEEWQKNNHGISELGSDTVIVRKEVQAADGSLKDYAIPANQKIVFIVNSPLVSERRLTLQGSYVTEGNPDQPVSITLQYEIDKNMGLGIYDFYYTDTLLH